MLTFDQLRQELYGALAARPTTGLTNVELAALYPEVSRHKIAGCMGTMTRYKMVSHTKEGKVIRYLAKEVSAPYITHREQDVLNLIFTGKSNIEIGQILGISSLTVKNHVQALLQRAGTYSRTGLVYNALQKGWLTPPAKEQKA